MIRASVLVQKRTLLPIQPEIVLVDRQRPIDHHERVPRFSVLDAFVVFRFRATAMLSTRFGYFRPAALARARASLFCAGESRVLRSFGFFCFQGGRESEREVI